MSHVNRWLKLAQTHVWPWLLLTWRSNSLNVWDLWYSHFWVVWPPFSANVFIPRGVLWVFILNLHLINLYWAAKSRGVILFIPLSCKAWVSQNLCVVGEVSVAYPYLVYFTIVFSALGEVFTHLRERVLTWGASLAKHKAVRLRVPHIALSATSVLRAHTSLKPKLAEVAKVWEVLDVQCLLFGRKRLINVNVNVVEHVQIIRPIDLLFLNMVPFTHLACLALFLLFNEVVAFIPCDTNVR